MKYLGSQSNEKDLSTIDSSNATVAFTAASSRTNISTGEKLSVLFGKIAKWFTDLGSAAFRAATSIITQDSTDLIESGAVYTGLAEKTPKSDLASISATGSTNTTGATITKGTYLYLDGTLVQALADIASGAAYTNGTNYEIVTAGALNKINSRIACLEIATDLTGTSLDAFKSSLKTVASGLTQYTLVKLVRVLVNFTGSKFANGATYIGYVANIDTTPTYQYFTAYFVSNIGDIVVVGYSNGTWYINKANMS